MVKLLSVLIAGLFVALLFLNLYFRVKVFKSYRRLVENKVEFGAAQLFNRKRLEAEVIPRYPAMATEIRAFSSHLLYSVKMATLLLVLITALGAALLYTR